MEMPGRKWAASNYRYSYNGQEKEQELFAGANSAEYWMYDSRLGRRWNIDPVVDESISPYACFADNPIYFNDPSGLSPTDPDKGGKKTVKHGSSKGTDGKMTKIPDKTVGGGNSGTSGNTGSGTSNGNNGAGSGERGKGGAQVMKNAVDKVASFLYKTAKVASYIRIQSPTVKMGVFDPANNPPKYLQRNYYLLAASSLNHANLGNAISNNNYPDRLAFINWDFFLGDFSLGAGNFEFSTQEGAFGTYPNGEKFKIGKGKGRYEDLKKGTKNFNYKYAASETYYQLNQWVEIGNFQYYAGGDLNNPLMKSTNQRVVLSLTTYQIRTLAFRTERHIKNDRQYFYNGYSGGTVRGLDTHQTFLNAGGKIRGVDLQLTIPLK